MRCICIELITFYSEGFLVYYLNLASNSAWEVRKGLLSSSAARRGRDPAGKKAELREAKPQPSPGPPVSGCVTLGEWLDLSEL